MDFQIDDNKEPLVSIIITSYNRDHFIKSAIESALAQNYPNLEIIISDNASADNTDSIIRKYISDSRIKYFKNEVNIGMIANFKLATLRASGHYITYLSSDDYLINNSFISEGISLISQYSNILLVLGRYDVFHEDTKKIVTYNDHSITEEFFAGNELFMDPRLKRLSWAAALMHKKSLLSFQPFEKPFTAMDVMTCLKLMLMGNVALIHKSSYMLRVHEHNASTGINLEQAINNFLCITEPYTTALKNNIIPKEKLDKWKFKGAFVFTKNASVQLAPQHNGDYVKFIEYVKDNFPGVLQKLRWNLKWNALIFLFKRPAISLKLFYLISRNHYTYLKSLVENNKKTSGKVKL